MEKIFEVKYGSIYTNSGTMIDNMTVIIDKDTGLLKYGEANRGMDKIFNDMVSKYNKAGLDDIANSLILVKFDRYDGILSIEEVCTFSNYMTMCSGNADIIMKMLFMDEKELKEKIKVLAEIGY